MAETIVQLTAEPRPTGSAVSRRARRDGYIPAVVYGPGAEPVAVNVEGSRLHRIVSRYGLGHLVQLTVTGEGRPRPVVVKELQRHRLTHQVSHADFLQVDPDRPIKISVPVAITGDDLVRKRGLVVTQQVAAVEIECKPAEMPSSLTLDLSELAEPGGVTAAQLSLPAGVRLLADPELTLAACMVPASVTAANAEEAAEETQED